MSKNSPGTLNLRTIPLPYLLNIESAVADADGIISEFLKKGNCYTLKFTIPSCEEDKEDIN